MWPEAHGWAAGVETHTQVVTWEPYSLTPGLLGPLKGFCAYETEQSWVSWWPKHRSGKLGRESVSFSEVMWSLLNCLLSFSLLSSFAASFYIWPLNGQPIRPLAETSVFPSLNLWGLPIGPAHRARPHGHWSLASKIISCLWVGCSSQVPWWAASCTDFFSIISLSRGLWARQHMLEWEAVHSRDLTSLVQAHFTL